MFKCLTRASFLALLSLSTPIAGSVALAQDDPAGGQCDGLDPSSGLFSTCIQAHSAANRVEHLEAVGANANAVARAQASFDAALATYAELSGGMEVPGFEAAFAILAVAYINFDGVDGYDPSDLSTDVLIAKITDDNQNGEVDWGDTITTNQYPSTLSPIEVHNFTNLTRVIDGTVFSSSFHVVAKAGLHEFLFQIQVPSLSKKEVYQENDLGLSNAVSTISDVHDGTASDRTRIRESSPSLPSFAADELRTDLVDNIFLDVDLFFTPPP